MATCRLVDMDDALYTSLQRGSNFAEQLGPSLIDDVSSQRCETGDYSRTVWDTVWRLIITGSRL